VKEDILILFVSMRCS